ncbi:MAG TPA: hypothetical protein VE987_06050 [Polyangiaceae bacterium]|nr:hypothetical protein [Polyangiaceae bacterium]
MFDPPAPSAERVLRELRDPVVVRCLVKYAARRTGSRADGDDVLADAIQRVCDPAGKPWEPDKASFTRHMQLVIDDLVVQRARRGHRRFEDVRAEPDGHPERVDPAPLPDEEIERRDELTRWAELGGRLLERLGDRDPLAVAVFRAAAGGLSEPAAMAKKLGCRVQEVYDAMRRLKYHGAQIQAEAEQRSAVGGSRLAAAKQMQRGES